MAALCRLKLPHLPCQFSMLHDPGIAGCSGLDHGGLGKRGVDILGGAHAARSRPELGDETGLGGQRPPAIGIETAKRDVAPDLDFRVRLP